MEFVTIDINYHLSSNAYYLFIEVICYIWWQRWDQLLPWFPEAIPLKSIAAEAVAEEIVKVFSSYGIPKEIPTDQELTSPLNYYGNLNWNQGNQDITLPSPN